MSTSRLSNNEWTPIITPYEGCAHQGIGAGWGDDYFIGLDCQWIDITDVDTSAGPVTLPLEFRSNPDQFLCEGTPVRDAAGKLVFETTSFKTEDGLPIDRPKCEFSPGGTPTTAARPTPCWPQRAAWSRNHVQASSGARAASVVSASRTARCCVRPALL